MQWIYLASHQYIDSEGATVAIAKHAEAYIFNGYGNWWSTKEHTSLWERKMKFQIRQQRASNTE